jgi:hypothetical protein
MNLRTPLATLALALLATTAFAQTAAPQPAPVPGTHTPRIDARQERQEQRIEQGQQSGSLTERETRRLEAEQKLIGKAEDRAKADGSVSAQERKRLHKMQNHSHRDIRRQKHDAQGSKP